MSTDNKAIYLRILNEYFGADNEAVLDAFYAENHVNHFVGVNGAQAWKQFMVPMRAAFPDLHFTVYFQMAEGDKVMNCWTAHATHAGNFMDVPPTGKQVAYNGISAARMEGGKVVEEWTVMDMVSLMQQVGVIPSSGSAEG
jgi:predicted ester cyclase